MLNKGYTFQNIKNAKMIYKNQADSWINKGFTDLEADATITSEEVKSLVPL